MKRLFSIITIFMLSLAFAFNVYAIEPRAEVCPECDAGRMVTITREEMLTSRNPCVHGYGGAVDMIYTVYYRTYYECSACHRWQKVTTVVGPSDSICTANP